MEALLYRHLVQELQPMLIGRRLERIYAPRLGWWTFRLQPGEYPRHFLFSHHPESVSITLSSHSPENPAAPTSQVMGLRKRIQGKRILGVRSNWVKRRLALGMGLHESTSWLILDAKKGVALENQAPEWQPDSPDWPSLDQIRVDSRIWHRYPQISPLLRQTLQTLPEDLGIALLNEFASGLPPKNFYIYQSPSSQSIACPWILPEPIRGNLTQTRCETAFAATKAIAEEIFFQEKASVADLSAARAHKRKKRLLKNLDSDEQRLLDFVRMAEQAQLIRRNLYQLPDQVSGRSRLERITLPEEDGTLVDLVLDARLTILENMERWFRLADKGRRGLVHVQRRREAITAQASPAHDTAPRPASKPTNAPGRKLNKSTSLPLHRFLSSDGFMMLRGKNQKANHALLTKTASSFDFWFHAADGPGAHLILKRNFPEQDVPEQTMIEAAGLAGLASHFSSADRATIICAQVKYVRAVKGTPGLARVDRVHRTLHVTLDPNLENKLRIVDDGPSH
ncbi:NFACT RNA binding domain-containing protein [Desulfonatronum parangueonense]